jgi:MoxR-like ATPase
VFATRNPTLFKGLESLEGAIQLGASPRASICLKQAARATALLRGRTYATPQDVKDVAHDVLRHRLLLTYEAEAENLTPDSVIDRLLTEVPVP